MYEAEEEEESTWPQSFVMSVVSAAVTNLDKEIYRNETHATKHHAIRHSNR